MGEYFTTTQPLQKDELLNIFQAVLNLTQLFVAPFGLPSDAVEILGEFIAKRDFKAIRRSWEDFISRKVYTLQEVSDDRVAASLQHYESDKDIGEAMRLNDSAVSSLLFTSSVVELPAAGIDLEELACAAFLAVASAWKQVEDDVSQGLAAAAAGSETQGGVKEVNTIHPCDVSYIVSFLSLSTVKSLLTCLDNIACPSSPAAAGVTLSYQQYLALLEVFLLGPTGSASPRVTELFASLDTLMHASVPETSSSGDRLVASLSSYYGSQPGGMRIYIRRLRALGWRQGMLFHETQYLPSPSSDSGSGRVKRREYSPFSHPVVGSVVFLEECLRGNLGGPSEDSECRPSHSVAEQIEKVHMTYMELLGVYNDIMRKRYGNIYGELKSDQELEEEEEREMNDERGSESLRDSVLEVMFAVEEAIEKFERCQGETRTVTGDREEGEEEEKMTMFHFNLTASASEQSWSLCDTILAAFLLERALCRIKTEEIEEALEDINRALSIDPKSAVAYKSRFKIHSRLAMISDLKLQEGDDENEEENEEESGGGAKKLLMKSAYDALAAFILDGSTNLLLAGAAEDAAREAIRQDAKDFFWDRQNSSNMSDDSSDWSDDDGDDDDDDEEEEEEEEEGGEEVVGGVENQGSKGPAHSRGRISSLLSEEGGATDQSSKNRETLESLLASSALPRPWLVNSYMSLFAPLNIALNISTELIESNISFVHDGIDEEIDVPFQYLLEENSHKSQNSGNKVEKIKSEKHVLPEEGDFDGFKLICSISRLLLQCKSVGKIPSSSQGDDSAATVTSLVDDENDNLVTVRAGKWSESELEDSVEVWSAESLIQLSQEICLRGDDIVVVESGLIAPSKQDTQHSAEDSPLLPDISTLSLNNDSDENTNSNILRNDDAPLVSSGVDQSNYFREAFSLISSGSASALSGVMFNWSETAVDDEKQESGELDAHRFRISVEVLDGVMSSRKDGKEEDGKEEEGDEEEEEEEDEESSGSIVLRPVSARLRSRLLSLCGSIAYLCGDSMGAYKCLKASILLDDGLLDSRLKISSILLEMDELDKAEAQLMDAKSRPYWENNLCLDLHLAELYINKTDYFPAVRILRTASRRLDFLLEDWQGGLSEESSVAAHIGPTIVSLLGVAEFRVAPDSPLKALNILQEGVQSYPDNVALCVCYGEVLSQAGDPAGALKLYSNASHIEPTHPLPYLNASRVYQQLNQMQFSKKHMAKAFELDRTLSLTLVDIAQFKLHEKRFLDKVDADIPESTSSSPLVSDVFFNEKNSEEILEMAIGLSRHVSEVIDVFTSRQITKFYTKLGTSGVAPVFL